MESMESGIHGCGIRNPQKWNPASGIRNPESTAWNLESRTLLDYLTWGDAYLKANRCKFDKLMSVFHASVVLLIMNFVITLSK